jgi:hypothetical protein
LLAILVPVFTIPLNWIIIKIQNNPSIYTFRLDMIINGLIRGFFVVYFTNYFLFLLNTDISIWWFIAVFIFLSFNDLNTWDRRNPFVYEFCLNISPIFGYLIGLFFIL